MEHERDRFDDKAREFLRDSKREEAKRVLKLKKLRVKAITIARESLHKMQVMVVNIETKQQQIDMMAGLQAGTRLLQQLNEELPPERVEAVLGATDDAVAEAWQSAEMLASGSAGGPPIDEAALDAELEALLDGPVGETGAAPAAAGTGTSTGSRSGADVETAAIDASRLPSAPTDADARPASPTSPTLAADAASSGRVAVAAS